MGSSQLVTDGDVLLATNALLWPQLPCWTEAVDPQHATAAEVRQQVVVALHRIVVACRDVLDPGIGIWTPFRSVEDDWTLCQHFSEFQKFERPLLAAISRKTFIGDLLNRPPEDRLSGSLAVTFMLLEKGASIVRTHDVAQTLDVIRVFEHLVKR